MNITAGLRASARPSAATLLRAYLSASPDAAYQALAELPTTGEATVDLLTARALAAELLNVAATLIRHVAAELHPDEDRSETELALLRQLWDAVEREAL